LRIAHVADERWLGDELDAEADGRCETFDLDPDWDGDVEPIICAEEELKEQTAQTSMSGLYFLSPLQR